MKIVGYLASILALRFFGLFLVMPLLALHATQLPGGTPFLAGVAVGGYALMQMLFQYPFGHLSDRFGRRGMIAAGMLIFAAGSVVCALSDSIAWLIAGRFLQGAGAVSAVITATIGDLIDEEKRSQAMAMMGGSIALSFVVALLVGPIIGGHYGVSSLFWVSAVLAIGAVLVLKFKVPTPPRSLPFEPLEGSKLRRVLQNRDLVRLNGAMFLHSFVMTATFLFIPLVLTRQFGWVMTDLWKIYLPAVFFGILAMGLGAVLGEKYNRVKTVMIAGIVLLIGAFSGLFFFHAESMFLVWVVVIFMGINSLEPLMQSSATKFARAAERGAALGLFNACQFFGVFAGGLSAGWVYGAWGMETLALMLAVLAALWLLATLGLTNPVKMKLLTLEPAATPLKPSLSQNAIESLPGVADCYKSADGQKIYLRFNPAHTDEARLRAQLLN